MKSVRRHWAKPTVELILIVVGILIALGIDSWLADRADRRHERVYLELLARDLTEIEDSLRRQAQFEQSMMNVVIRIEEIMDSGRQRDHAVELGDLLTVSTFRSTLFIDSAAFADLLSTGNLGLIRDRELRDEIVRFFSAAERFETVVRLNNRDFVDYGWLPFLRESGLALHDHVYTTESELLAAAWPERIFQHTESDVRPPRNEMLLSPPESQEWAKLRQQITWRSMHARNIGQRSILMLERVRATRAAIEARL